MCRQCPVQGKCLDFALRFNQEAGIWGGATERNVENCAHLAGATRGASLPAIGDDD